MGCSDVTAKTCAPPNTDIFFEGLIVFNVSEIRKFESTTKRMNFYGEATIQCMNELIWQKHVHLYVFRYIFVLLPYVFGDIENVYNLSYILFVAFFFS